MSSGSVSAGIGAAVAASPVPVSATVCGLPEALSVVVRVPVRVPEAVGVKVTVTTHSARALSVAPAPPQLFDCAKSPEVAIPVIESGLLPVFVRMMGCPGLVVPIAWLPNERLVGQRVAAGASIAFPERSTMIVWTTVPGVGAAAIPSCADCVPV